MVQYWGEFSVSSVPGGHIVEVELLVLATTFVVGSVSVVLSLLRDLLKDGVL